MKTIVFLSSVKAELVSVASHNKYDQVVQILRRGNSEELIIADLNEAQAIIDTVRKKLLDIQLKYPNWDYELPNYNEDHEGVFQQFQNSKWGFLRKRYCMFLKNLKLEL